MMSQISSIKRGMIVIWSGAVANIPAGWSLCNGANGTPDLSERFVRCVSDVHPVGETGGLTQHTHTVDCGNHYHTVGPIPPHRMAAGEDYDEMTDQVHVTGDTNTVNHIPPYYILAYIMKL